MYISKEIFKEINKILEKYEIPYTVHYRSRKCSDVTVRDKHIQINLVIPDYFEESGELCTTKNIY